MAVALAACARCEEIEVGRLVGSRRGQRGTKRPLGRGYSTPSTSETQTRVSRPTKYCRAKIRRAKTRVTESRAGKEGIGKTHLVISENLVQSSRSRRMKVTSPSLWSSIPSGGRVLHLHIGRFQVAVDDAIVRSVQSLSHLKGNGEGFVQRYGSLSDSISQRQAFDQFEHQGADPIAFLQAVDAGDVGVV